MNLRFIVRDGKKILQQIFNEQWIDVPLVEEPKPRVAREWLLAKNSGGWHATFNQEGYPLHMIEYTGPEHPTEVVRVREVLE